VTDTVERLKASARKPPFHDGLGLEVVAGDAAAGTATVRLPYKPAFARSPASPQIHGGVIAALADIAGDYALAVSLGGGVPTIDLRVDYLRPAEGDLVAEARTVKRGRTIGVVDVEIRDTAGRLVAVGRGAYATTVG
jgi:uncharacterized protein (TIGR00369 family)